MPHNHHSHRKQPQRQSMGEFVCSEKDLLKRFFSFFEDVQPGDWLFLEGPLGAGKSTLARGLIQHLGANSGFQGSPTFALAHEYETQLEPLIHIDFYRLKNETEIFDSGLEAYFSEKPEAVILTEWISLFPEMKADLLAMSGKLHRVFEIEISIEGESERRFKIWQWT